MQNILITGSNGFLARHLLEYLFTKNKYNIFASGLGNLRGSLPANTVYLTADLTQQLQVEEIFKIAQPNIVVHLAANSKPNECELDKKAAVAANLTATEFVTNACNLYNAQLIFSSTDFIFGEGENHTENEEAKPVNYYGETKYLAEKFIKENSNHYCIFRPVFMYGKLIKDVRGSFIQWVHNNLAKGKPIKVVNDQFRTPTYVINVCQTIEQIIEKKASGIYHLNGDDVMTPYQMAIAVAQLHHHNTDLITAVTADSFKEPAARNLRSLQSNKKAKEELGFCVDKFNEAIKLCF